jgi:hypothetical protein
MNGSGTISGTPSATGNYSFTVRVVDDNGTAGTLKFDKQLSISVASTPQAPSSGSSSSNTDSPQVQQTSTITPTASTQQISESEPDELLLNDQPEYSSSGVTKTFSKDEVVYFELLTSDGGGTSSEKHSVTVNNISPDYADITVASDPIHFRLYIGKYKEVDVDKDGNPDLYVSLLSIASGKAKLLLKQIVVPEESPNSTLSPTQSKLATTPVPKEPASTVWQIWTGITVVFLLILAVVALMVRKRRRRGYQFKTNA